MGASDLLRRLDDLLQSEVEEWKKVLLSLSEEERERIFRKLSQEGENHFFMAVADLSDELLLDLFVSVF